MATAPDFAQLDRDILRGLQTPDDATIYYTPAGGSQAKLDDAIFRSPDTPIIGTDLEFEGVGPQFAVHGEDCPDLAQGDAFQRAGVDYEVTEVHKDEGFLWLADVRLT